MIVTNKSEATKMSIVDAAYRLIKAQGYDATHIKQICVEAGVSYNTFYSYFPTKESVFTMIFSRTNLFRLEDISALLSVEGEWNKLLKAHLMR